MEVEPPIVLGKHSICIKRFNRRVVGDRNSSGLMVIHRTFTAFELPFASLLFYLVLFSRVVGAHSSSPEGKSSTILLDSTLRKNSIGDGVPYEHCFDCWEVCQGLAECVEPAN